jgi:hypothetical protein
MQRQLVQGQPQALSQQSSSSQPVANAIHHSQQNKAAVISQTSTFNSDPKNQAKEEANPSDNQNKKPLRQPLAPLFVATRNAKSASLVNTGTGANKHQGVNAVSAGRSHHMNIR